MFSRTNIEILRRIYIARQISTWRRVYLSVIYCSFIWFNYVRNLKTITGFDFVIRSPVVHEWRDTCACKGCLCDVNISYIFILNLASFKVRKQTIRLETGGNYLLTTSWRKYFYSAHRENDKKRNSRFYDLRIVGY